MKFSLTLFFIFTVLGWPLSYAMADVVFSVKPLKCVALHKGQVCYQKLNFKWNSDNKDLCLYALESNAPLHCNVQNTPVTFRYEFANDHNQVFELRDKEGNSVATVKIEVASVYKGKRRATTGWRIF